MTHLTEEAMVRGLREVLTEFQVLSGAAAQRGYDCDAYTVERAKPTCVVLPESTEEVARVVRWCVANSVPFTARGAGTGLSGGVLPALGGVVVSTKRMTSILEIDVENRCLKAQAGAVNKRITDAVREHGLHFAPDPSSQTVSTLGGNIAENAGGPHTLKYGVTAQHILGLTMVTPEGEVIELGGKVPGAPGYDFVSLIVGGEGTLGIVTEAWVKLTPLPAAVKTALVAFPTVRDATQAVADIIASGTVPAALEMMDKNILRALEAAFGLKYPEGTAALLLVECDAALGDLGTEGPREPGAVAGEDVEATPLTSEAGAPETLEPVAFVGSLEEEQPSSQASKVQGSDSPQSLVDAEMAMVVDVCQRNNAIDVTVAEDEAERAKLWTARKKGVGAMGRIAPSIVTHDGVIPRSKLPEMLDFVYAVAEKHGVGVANIFHAGDGNLHPCFYFDDRDPTQVAAVVEAGEEIIRRCVELGGSVTGEHGIGVEKIDLMPLMFSEDDLRLQAMAKRIFNDGSLCNPCKVLPNQKSCVEHKMRWRGVAW